MAVLFLFVSLLLSHLYYLRGAAFDFNSGFPDEEHIPPLDSLQAQTSPITIVWQSS
jgi:hypothetical protein